MSKQLLIIIALSIMTMTLCKRAELGADCHAFQYCEKGLTCVDYRCQIYLEGKPYKEIEWTPKGPKCDWIHYCEKKKECVNHRCQLIVQETTTKTSAKLK